MLPTMNQQLPLLSQDDYNDYIEFQNFKRLKYAQQQFKSGLNQSMNQSLNLFPDKSGNSSSSSSAAATAAAINFLNNSGNIGTTLNSIFPMTTSASINTNSMLAAANQSFLNQQHHHHQQQHQQQQQQQQSTQIIPKVVPHGLPLQIMRQPSPASFMSPYKNVPNFPGLKGGASNYTQQSPTMFMPPSMPIQTLTPKVATPTTPIQQQQPQQRHIISPITPQTILNPIPTIPKSPPKKRAASPEIIVDDRPEDIQMTTTVIPEKKTKLENFMPELYTTNNESNLPQLSQQSSTERLHHITSSSISTLPSIDNNVKTTPSSSIISLPSSIASLSSSITSSLPSTNTISSTTTAPEKILSFPQHPSEFMDAEETHIIITARPRVPDSAERDESYTTDEDSDYDTNLRPKETPLQYKERMMVRVMDKAKRKNEASKRSREKRKREHQDRQVEKQRLEKRNMELTEKLMNLKEALKRLRPQICSSCNEQVQKFLDQCQSSKEGMNVFVLRPCKQDKCPGNKSVGREIGKFARGQ